MFYYFVIIRFQWKINSWIKNWVVRDWVGLSLYLLNRSRKLPPLSQPIRYDVKPTLPSYTLSEFEVTSVWIWLLIGYVKYFSFFGLATIDRKTLYYKLGFSTKDLFVVFFPPIVSWVCISSVLSFSISFSLLRFMSELTLRSSASQLLTLAS